jgi:ABC-type oligopeptide transport system substrate-binding subunit
VAPNFATGYEVSKDGTVYTFTMREGLKWSDGSDLTAKDFEYSWKRAADPMTGADYSFMFDGIKGYKALAAVVACLESNETGKICKVHNDLMPVKVDAAPAAAKKAAAPAKKAAAKKPAKKAPAKKSAKKK